MDKVFMDTLKKYAALVVFCLVYLLVGIFTYKNYGITADEYIEYTAGKVVAGYYLNKNVSTDLEEWQLPKNSTYFRGHAAIYSLFNPQGYYEWYHLINILVALTIFITIYFVFYLSCKSSFAGILGILFLFFIPRFIGDIPANPKDIPFAILYYLSLFLIYLWLKIYHTHKYRYLFLSVIGIIFGCTQSFRILGTPLYVIFLLSYFIKSRNIKNTLQSTGFIVLIGFFITYILMPVMHTDPINGFIKILLSSKQFTPWDNKILFNGIFLFREERPWQYLFVWIWITSPIYLIFTNIIALINIKKLVKYEMFSLSLGSLIIGMTLYLSFNPIIYNGLRHFIYFLPLLATTGGIAFMDLYTKSKKLAQIILFSGLVANFLVIGVSLVKLHPYEYIYFNELFGGIKSADSKYDLDYWSTSYKEGMETLRIYEKTTGEKAGVKLKKVYPCTLSFGVHYYAQGEFEITGDSESADYIICDKDNLRLEGFKGEIVGKVERLNVDLLYILKR